jgi:glycosyltransferase involved in cell wall biosynthesis
MRPLRIAYLIEDTGIAGGIRVALAHADVLTDLGHEATLITRGGPLTWRQTRARWQHVQSFDEVHAAGFDFIVGTFWTTLADAWRLGGSRGVHFCQGYEGSFTGYRQSKAAIDDAYRLPLPKITVSPHLVPICRRFHDDATYIGQIVDDAFYQPRPPRDGAARVLLVGPAQADFKGVDVGYEAVRRARAAGAEFDLVRVSQWLPADGEPTNLAAEFHVGVNTAEMAALISSCDVFLGPSRAEEGFGLPAAEAMASGVPAVLSEIPSFLSWDGDHDYALWAAEGDAEAMAAQLRRLLHERALREMLSRRGREVVEQFRAGKTGARLEEWFRERSR